MSNGSDPHTTKLLQALAMSKRAAKEVQQTNGISVNKWQQFWEKAKQVDRPISTLAFSKQEQIVAI